MSTVDWTKSMQQSFEYYIVDPYTWQDESILDCILSSSIDKDYDKSTICTATISATEELDECYIRIYLIVIQDGVRYKFALGTFLVQTPSLGFNGKYKTYNINAYSPLLELNDVLPPIGYFAPKNSNIMDLAYELCCEYARAPITPAKCDTLLTDDLIANTDDTWLTFLTSMMAYAKYKFSLDPMGRILFEPIQSSSILQPVWTFNDDNSSLLYPDVTVDRDLYGIPNTVEVLYSVSNANGYANPYISQVENNDVNSPISIINRGRKVVHRETNPSFSGDMTEEQIDEYSKELLKSLSALEFTVSYSHGYCPVNIGDCAYLNYTKAGLTDIKAIIKTQTIECKTGCKISETATYTKSLWEG